MQRDARLARLSEKLDVARREIYGDLNRWQITLVARHARRPYALDYIDRLLADFVELRGDRAYRDDPAIVGGFGSFHGEPVCVIGHQKGRNTKEKLHRNFGMPNPEGYRKALRIMKMAAKFNRPIFTLIDTPGAYPGAGAEERGVSEAIAVNLREMARLPVPIVVSVIGEGGSGGALAIGVGDRVNMMEFSIFSVISPESCSSILWHDQDHPEEAAEALRLTAPDLLEKGLIDDVVKEPLGGAHADPEAIANNLDATLSRQLAELRTLDEAELLRRRYQRFRALGSLETNEASG